MSGALELLIRSGNQPLVPLYWDIADLPSKQKQSREGDSKVGALRRSGFAGNGAAVAVDDLLADGQAEVTAIGFAECDEGLEDLVYDRVGDTRAVVAEVEQQLPGLFLYPDDKFGLAGRRLAQALLGVAREVEDDPFECV
jgi:hypothetical protein